MTCLSNRAWIRLSDELYWLQGYQVRDIPDVKRCGQLFSDGVGRVSQELAQGMAARLGRAGRIPAGHTPSAFQIRYAGAKGVVTVHPPLQGRKCVCTQNRGLQSRSQPCIRSSDEGA